MERDWFRAACAEPTAAAQLRTPVRGVRETLARVAPTMPLIAAASATDPEIAAQWPPGQDPRYTVQRAAAEALTAKPDAHPGLDTARAADILGCSAPSCTSSSSATVAGPPTPGRSGPARP